MRSVLALILVTACVLPVCAQTSDTLKFYLNKNWKRVDGPQDAAYYRMVTPTKDGKFHVQDHYMSGQLRKEALCTAYDPELVWDGVTKFYHENGTVSEEGPFRNGQRYGLHQYWYDNGARYKEAFFREKETVYHHYWSRSGEPLLANGKGTIKEQAEEVTYYVEIEDSVQIASFRIEGADTIYMKVKQLPEYEGGHQAMVRTIGKTMKYPASARRTGIEGTVYVQFVVDKNGNIKDCTIKRGIDRECDEEAVRAVSTLERWTPGFHKGKPVQVRFILPLQFKLSE